MSSGDLYIPSNTLELYAVSRKVDDVVEADHFTLGSLALTAVTNIGTGIGGLEDRAVDVAFVDFKLSNYLGADLGFLRTDHDSTTVVKDIDLAWLSGTVSVKSELALGAEITTIADVTLNIGGKIYTADPEGLVNSWPLTMIEDSPYIEDSDGHAAAVVLRETSTNGETDATLQAAYATTLQTYYHVAQESDDQLNIAVGADMWGHLACSTTAVDLGDTGGPTLASTKIGDAGVITLLAGDVNDDGAIDNGDWTMLNQHFNDTNVLTEDDINLDSKVDIFDLVHVGRNYGTDAMTDCSSS